MVRPTLTPNQARVVGAVLGMTGFALASVSGLSAANVAADTHIPAGKIWVVAAGSDKGPPEGDFVRSFDCQNIDVRAFKLDEKSGDYTIYWDDHEGKDQKVTTGDWSFDKKKKDDPQTIARIDARDLIAKLEDHHFDAQDNGWHLDIKFHDPDKMVEFILKNDCPEEHHESPPPPSEQHPTPSKPAPKPAPVATTTAAKAAAAVPQTGADVPFLAGMVLMTTGGASLLLGGRLRRRQEG